MSYEMLKELVSKQPPMEVTGTNISGKLTQTSFGSKDNVTVTAHFQLEFPLQEIMDADPRKLVYMNFRFNQGSSAYQFMNFRKATATDREIHSNCEVELTGFSTKLRQESVSNTILEDDDVIIQEEFQKALAADAAMCQSEPQQTVEEEAKEASHADAAMCQSETRHHQELTVDTMESTLETVETMETAVEGTHLQFEVDEGEEQDEEGDEAQLNYLNSLPQLPQLKPPQLQPQFGRKINLSANKTTPRTKTSRRISEICDDSEDEQTKGKKVKTEAPVKTEAAKTSPAKPIKPSYDFTDIDNGIIIKKVGDTLETLHVDGRKVAAEDDQIFQDIRNAKICDDKFNGGALFFGADQQTVRPNVKKRAIVVFKHGSGRNYVKYKEIGNLVETCSNWSDPLTKKFAVYGFHVYFPIDKSFDYVPLTDIEFIFPNEPKYTLPLDLVPGYGSSIEKIRTGKYDVYGNGVYQSKTIHDLVYPLVKNINIPLLKAEAELLLFNRKVICFVARDYIFRWCRVSAVNIVLNDDKMSVTVTLAGITNEYDLCEFWCRVIVAQESTTTKEDIDLKLEVQNIMMNQHVD